MLQTRLALCALALAAASPAAAQYPSKSVRLIVPFSPGGAADVPARIVAQKLADALGQQVVVDNRPGAGSTIGAELTARAAPDGYTLLTISNTHFVASTLHKVKYRPLDDFTPITAFVSSPNVLVVHPGFEAKNVKELIAAARAAPGKLDFASSGNGSSQHLFGILFTNMAGVVLTHIPYRGSGPATADMLAGQVKIGFPGIAIALPHVKSAKLRALGVTSIRRSPELPETPTISEAGVKGYDATQWMGLAGPRGLPPDIARRLYDEMLKIVRNPEVAKSLLSTGNEVFTHDATPQFLAFMREEATKWAKVVKDSGAQVN
jgi:tripartite-type tricarboxylate transporter receptor subunit TctC